MSRDNAVGITTGYGQDDGRFGVRVPVGSRKIIQKYRPALHRGPPKLLSIGD
jgi:hypothetical protein